MKNSTVLFTSSATLVSFCAIAVDWPQFQGPDRDGKAQGKPIAKVWSDGVPRETWFVSLHEGFGGAAIRDGEVYVLDRNGDIGDALLCLSLDSGDQLWTFVYDAPGEVSHHGSRATPTVTERYVYSVGMTGHLYCIDRDTHEPVWHRDLARDFPPAKNLKWGHSQAPVVYNDLLIVAPQSESGFVVAFDRADGEVRWKSAGLGDPGYSSPAVVTLGDTDQVVMVSAGSGGVSGLSLDDGSVLWNYDGWRCRIPIPFVTQVPGDRLFITGTYGAGSAMIQVLRDGDGFRVEEEFTTNECASQIHQPILYGGHLYMHSNGNMRNDGMLCLTLDGTVCWRTRDTRGLPRFQRGGLLMVNDSIIALDGRHGTLHLIEPSPEAYRELASAKVLDGAKPWSPMAFSEGRLIVRDQERMRCLDLREQ